MDELKVGQVWIGCNSLKEKEILSVGKSNVFFRVDDRELCCNIEIFKRDHSLKKEKKTISLLGFVRRGLFIEYEEQWVREEMSEDAMDGMELISQRTIEVIQ